MGLLIIISSPTGGGKDAIIARLLKIFPKAARLVTTTSRQPRPSDQEGVTYHFISPAEFETKIKADYFLEYNNMVGNYYGTPKKYLQKLLAENDLVFANLDVNGKQSLDKLGIKHLSIFLLPESLEVLKQRVMKRGGMTNEMIEARLRLGAEEIEKSKDYDYRVTNYEGKLQETAEKIAEIIKDNPGLTKNK